MYHRVHAYAFKYVRVHLPKTLELTGFHEISCEWHVIKGTGIYRRPP